MPPLTRYKPWTCPCGKRVDGEYTRCQKCRTDKPPSPRRRKTNHVFVTPQQITEARRMLATKRIGVVAYLMKLNRQTIARISNQHGPIFDNPEVKVMK